MYPMTITIHNGDQLNAVLNAMSGAVQTTTTPAATVEKSTTEKPKAEAKKSAPAETPAQSSGTTSASAESSAPSGSGASEKTYSIDDAKALTMKIVASKGRDAAVKLLKKYGVPVAAKLAADQVAGFCADAEQVLV